VTYGLALVSSGKPTVSVCRDLRSSSLVVLVWQGHLQGKV